MTATAPCPFCGCEDVGPEINDTIGKWGAIACKSCGARGPDVRTGYGPPDEWEAAAAAEWNKRADTAPPTDIEFLARVAMAHDAPEEM